MDNFRSKRRSPFPPRPTHRRNAILAAVEQGCNRSADIEAVTGMPRNLTAAWLSKLIKRGDLRRNGRVIRHTGGAPAQCFELSEQERAEYVRSLERGRDAV